MSEEPSGRGREVDALVGILERGERVVTVVGAAGVGKSRVARRVAEVWSERAGSTIVVDLAGTADAGGFARALHDALGTIPSRVAGPSEPLLAAAQGLAFRGPLLVLLDGFDRLAAWGLVSVHRWRELAPTAQFLVTQRERLGIPEEVVFELEPLPAPPVAEDARATADERAVPPPRDAAEAPSSGQDEAERAYFLALGEQQQGHLVEARAAFTEARRAAESAGDVALALACDVQTALVALEEGDVDDARQRLERAEPFVVGFDEHAEGLLLGQLGAAKAVAGDLPEAGWLLDRAEKLLQATDVALLPAVIGPLRGVLDLARARRARASGDEEGARELERRAAARLATAERAGPPDDDASRGPSEAAADRLAAMRILAAALES